MSRCLPFATLLLAGLLVSCGKDQPATPAARAQARTEASKGDPVAEATVLGREIRDLMDRAMAYRSSHRGRSPASLRELGIDEMTPGTRRSLTVVAGMPRVTVAFRKTDGRMVASCSGDDRVLEDATLSGTYALDCTYVSGGNTIFTVPR
jgi:hypothetical protein